MDGRRYGRPLILLVVGLCVGVLGATAVYLFQPMGGRTPGSTSAQPAIPGPAVPAGGAAKGIQPVNLSIPAINVSSALVDLVLNPDHTLRPPADYQTAGWFAAGPAPGDVGGPPAVIAGHVDSLSGPAIFARLHELTEGSDVQVTGIDGVVRHFTVYRVSQYPKAAFPADQVYAASDRAELRLITCSGEFDRNAGSYLSNLVVYATMTP